MKAVIASTKGPTKGQFEAFVGQIRDFAAGKGVTLQGYTLNEGPGCANHGIMLAGGEAACKAFLDSLTMALMPAQWAGVPDADKGVEDGVFAYNLPE